MLISALLMGGIGLFFSLFLVLANKKYAVEVDPKQARLEAALPGLNCGGCGHSSCAAYAEALSKGAEIDLCRPGGEETMRAVARIMDVKFTAELIQKLAAVVFCQGDTEASYYPGIYRGIRDCGVAVSSQDVAKRCKFGCIGLGSCVAACKFDAIKLSRPGIPVVNAARCTACGQCVKACPRDLIELHPVNYNAFVFCKSHDPGPVARKICKRACIACRLCIHSAEKDNNLAAVAMQDNLAVVNTETYTAKAEYGEKCPTEAYAVNRNIIK